MEDGQSACAGSVEGKTPADLALVNDLQAFAKQRTQEKKARSATALSAPRQVTDGAQTGHH